MVLQLPGNPRGVRLRFAPNPNGPPTLGSARGIVLNHELARGHDGEFILRFDDTDPKLKRPIPEAYGWYLEACEWLGAKPDEVYYTSERVHLYYEYASKLLELGRAYVCFCPREKFRELRRRGVACEHRDQPREESLDLWDRMLGGEFEEGECVLRVKTDLKAKDPAARDWVGFRIIEDADHPRVGDKYLVWPTLDFESAIEDRLLRITHILRGKELADCEKRQRYIYDCFGWTYPEVHLWGRLGLEGFGRLSTSELRKGVEEGLYSGWDDPRLPTLTALKRRGIAPEAIRELFLEMGLSDVNAMISFENLYSLSRRFLDPRANRYFFVKNPKPLRLLSLKAKELVAELPLHPSFRERGYRRLFVRGKEEKAEVLVSDEDLRSLKEGEEIRLMNLCNVRIIEVKSDSASALVLEKGNLKVRKLHWLPAEGSLEAEVIKPEGVESGLVESTCRDLEVGSVVQFERYGFARLERVEGKKLTFCFAHP